MRCRNARKWLVPYLDREMTEAKDLEAHLAECPTCRAELESLRTSFDSIVGESLSHQSSAASTPNLVASVNNRIDDGDGWLLRIRKSLGPRPLSTVAWTAATLLLVAQLAGKVRLETCSDDSCAIIHFGSAVEIPILQIQD